MIGRPTRNGALPDSGTPSPNPWDLPLSRQNDWITLETLERRIGLPRDATRAPIPGPEWHGAALQSRPKHSTPRPRRTLTYCGQKMVLTMGSTIHYGIAFLARLAGDLEGERRESARVRAELFAVQVHEGLVVRGAEIEVETRAGLALEVESLSVPDGAFVEEETFALRVPIARYVELSRSVEVVLDEIALVLWLGVEEIAVLGGLQAEIVVPVLVRIHDSAPLPIQAGGPARFDIHDPAGRLRLDGRTNRQHSQNCKMCFHPGSNCRRSEPFGGTGANWSAKSCYGTTTVFPASI